MVEHSVRNARRKDRKTNRKGDKKTPRQDIRNKTKQAVRGCLFRRECKKGRQEDRENVGKGRGVKGEDVRQMFCLREGERREEKAEKNMEVCR